MVHWPLMGGLLHLVQWGGAWAGCGPLLAVPNVTAHHQRPVYQLYIIWCGTKTAFALNGETFLKTRNMFCRTRSHCPMQLFHFWPRDVYPVQNVQNFIEIGWFFCWDMAIYRFSKWRTSAILELFYHHTRPPTKSLLLAAAACQISYQSDTYIWRYSYFKFSHIWLEMPIQAPKWVIWGTLNP